VSLGKSGRKRRSRHENEKQEFLWDLAYGDDFGYPDLFRIGFSTLDNAIAAERIP